MSRLFMHDCDYCVYLGSDDKHDYYYHEISRHNTVGLIARYGNGGGSYIHRTVDSMNRDLPADYPPVICYQRYLEKKRQAVQCTEPIG